MAVLLEIDLSFLELGEVLLTVVLLFTEPFPLELLRWVVDLEIVLFLEVVLRETLLLFLKPSFLPATDLLDLRLLLLWLLYPLSLTATLLSFL